MSIQSSTQDLSSAELIIALTSAVGTDTLLITNTIEEHLKLFGYNTFVIKISQEILEPQIPKEKLNNPVTRANALMDMGNHIRKTKSKFILACAVAQKIREKRIQELKQTPEKQQSNQNSSILPKLEKTAFIITSLKHPEEVSKFREIYGNNFFLFAINENEESRISNLNLQNIGYRDAKNLILRDADENNKYGQHTRRVFEMADFHLTLNNTKKITYVDSSKTPSKRDIIKPQIARIIDLIFGNPYITPTFDEYAMFLAYASALRSADLSRQVGAVIANKQNEIISTGANDVPQFGGGQYWPDHLTYADLPKGRDYVRGCDANKLEHQKLINEIVDSYNYRDDKEKNDFKKRLQDSRIKHLTEFGRAVHAEMAAIIACSRTGISLDGSTLYCSTFPCHNCAKHIINAGIRRVVYIEPYPKSKTLELYDDSTTITGESDKVQFEEFVGIGPRHFFNLFSLKLSNGRSIIRKNDEGNVVEWNRENAQTRLQTIPISYIEKESIEILKWYNNGEKQ